MRFLVAGFLVVCGQAALADQHTIPLFVSAFTSDAPQGRLRILNSSGESGTVGVYAIDDAGARFGPATFTLNAWAAVEFEPFDFSSGNAAKGLSSGLGIGDGHFRLTLDADIPIRASAYVRAPDGTLAAMHDTVRGASVGGSDGYTYEVPVFNPASEVTQASRLRLINPGDAAASVTIAGRDDSGGAATGGDVTLTLAAGGARTLTAQQLEAGDTDLTGQLGAGTGKWRLTVSSDQPLEVVNIVASTAGYRNNLSTTAVAGAAPGDQAGFNERFVGNSIIYETSGARSTLEAADGNRFTDTVEADGVTETYMGSYSYRAIGPDAGLLTLDYDDGDACRANLYFSSRTSGWFASHCTGSDYPAEGSWLGGTWLVEADEDDGGDVVETTYVVNDALPGVPTSGVFAPSIIGGGSLQLTGSGTTIGLNNGAYIELNDGTRYTCASANGCSIVNGTVTAGTVTGRAPGAGEVDRFPSFRTAAAPGNRTYTVGTAIDTLTLPEATGGNGDLTYSLSPSVPGLTFNATARQLSGTPSTAGTHAMTYTVTDEDGDTDTLGFTITVSAGTPTEGSLGECYVSLTVGIGQSCTYPGTTDAFSVNARGRGSFLGRLAGIRIRIPNETIDGRVYDLEASHQGDGEWRIDRIAGSTEVPETPPMPGGGTMEPEDTSPSFAAGAGPGNQTYTVGTATDTLTLPEATGGNGGLTYSLSPSVPGLTFNATARQLSGTPSAAGTHAMTYTVTDEDGDSDTLSFTVTVEESADVGNDRAALMALYNATDGANWSRSDNWGTNAPLDQWYGVTADRNGRVIRLILRENQLSGPIPAQLGNLANLLSLFLDENQLSGPIPAQLGNLANLEYLNLHGNQLSGPIPAELGDLANLLLMTLSSNQLSGPITAELGNLANLEILRLGSNQLSGPIPAQLGNLANLAILWLGTNNLSGSIPPELANLASLEDLGLNVNPLTGSIPPELGNLANLLALRIWATELSGPIPPELGNLTSLETLSIGGNNITGSIPPELGNLANLEQLFITDNAVAGSIPPELGNLASLKRLAIRGTRVTGPIPPELGNLASLEYMWLNGNELTGSIPPQLNALDNLGYMYLGYNHLTGPIPPQLGALANLEQLNLGNNNLSGPIPPELGNLSSLTDLDLAGNDLSGPLPGMLGNLSTLEQLILANNALTGPVPPEFGAMSSVKQLVFTNNPGMAGALPSRLADLRRLEGLLAEGTDLCTPSDPGFQTWLDGVYKRRISACTVGEPPMAYLTQAVQSREFPVPLVAGEPALLRVFPTARQATSAGIPATRARFYVDGQEIHVENIPGKSAPIPTHLDESSLSKSANVEIPGRVVQPGLEMVIEVDPEGTLDEALEVAKRIPETGRLAVEVRAMPLFDLTLIPFVWSQTQDSSIVDLIQAMAADPENHEMLNETRTLLPVGDLAVKAHEPVLSSSNSAFAIRGQTEAIRAMEGGRGHYMGMMANPVTGAGGIAFQAGRSSFALPRARIIAHELGHNMNLQHAPCGTTGDAAYPYLDGSIGVWGYNFRDRGRLVHPARPDLMSYCFEDQWISDYSFTNALRYRLVDESPPAEAIAASSKSLLLWGGINADSVPFLEHAFVVDAPAALPDSAGEYRVTGQTTSGVELFSIAFTMPETADGDGSSSFAFVLPALPGWEGNVASITLAGPGGSFTLDGESDLPMAILRNPRTGQVRGILRNLRTGQDQGILRNLQTGQDQVILRNLPQTDAAAALVPQAGPDSIDVLISRGVPDAAAWGR